VDRRRNQGGDCQIQIAVLLCKFDQSALDRLNRFDGFHAATVIAGFHYTDVTCQMHVAAGRTPTAGEFQSDICTILQKRAEIKKCELAHILEEI
jgi:hypothetical protein